MNDSTAELIVVCFYRIAWFVAQSTIVWVLWNWAVAIEFEWPKSTYLNAVATYAMIRMVLKPPVLTIEKN